EVVGEALAGVDRLLREAGYPVHCVRQADAVPMDRRVLAELIADHEPNRLALANAQFRAGNSLVVGPHSGIRVSLAGQVDRRRCCCEPVFLEVSIREAAAEWE